ncbi:hypothetical protein MtrunA17_Chr2g0313131 [Medicago truncatula]|uniref:Uncharacterized protein n=1 Tax=Medicago truncatula TaxID=3880 RepID=A0A396J8V2_MEDTR|nr:hypothetical protein MtrunA17_Chr2g0313131 [Medicago truncatula]
MCVCVFFFFFFNLFCKDMAREEDEQHRLIRDARMHKGKEASIASARREKVDQNLCVPKARKRRDPRLVGEDSQSQMGYSSQEEEEAEDEEVADDEEVPHDVVADYLDAYNIVPEGESEPQTRRRRRVPLIPPCPVVGPPFPGGPETTILLSDYARHVVIPLWVNHHNMWHYGEYNCINAGRKVRELNMPEKGLRWFWDPVEASDLHGLIYTGYSDVTHAMICALCERWHT